MNLEEVQKQQAEIFDKIFVAGEPIVEKPVLSGLLRRVLDYSEDDVEFALGEFGVRLRNFARSIDLTNPHPDVFKIFGGSLANETSDFGKGVSDILDLMLYGQDRQTSNVVLYGLRKQLKKLADFKVINRAVDAPSRNLLHVRLVSDPVLRAQIRSQKRFQHIGLTSFYKKAQDAWPQHPASFASFFRFSNRFNEDISEAKLRFQHFNSLGLTAMAKGIDNSILEMESKSKALQYFGFNQISLTFASVVLAKLLGYTYSVDRKSIICDESQVEYEPIVYVYQGMKEYNSDAMKKVVEFLERFPEIGRKPLFDHYWVLTSTHLIKEQLIGILLGERDGQFYFICFWM